MKVILNYGTTKIENTRRISILRRGGSSFIIVIDGKKVFDDTSGKLDFIEINQSDSGIEVRINGKGVKP